MRTLPVLLAVVAMLHVPGALADDSDLRGRITLDLVNWIRHETVAVVDVTLPDGEMQRKASGRYGWRHRDGDLLRTQGCGATSNRLIVDRLSGESDVVSLCTNEMDLGKARLARFEFSKLSPDKRHIAAELRYYLGGDAYYAVLILRDKAVVAAFDGYSAPGWMPDGRVLLSGNGLFVADIDGKPERLDDGWLSWGARNPDVSPDGQIIVFEFNERLWIMDSEGKEHMELVSGPERYRFPVWSPDGHYVAFLSTSGDSHSQVTRALRFIDIRVGEFSHVDLRQYGGNLGHVPFGPMSWTR